MTANQNQINELGKIMIRVFLMQQVQMVNLNDLKDYSLCPPILKPDIGKVKAAMIGFKAITIKSLPDITANKMMAELSSERIHDINLILDHLHKIDNLSEVYTWLCEMTQTA